MWHPKNGKETDELINLNSRQRCTVMYQYADINHSISFLIGSQFSPPAKTVMDSFGNNNNNNNAGCVTVMTDDME